MVNKTSKTKNPRRLSKSQRTHVRRLKQEARKTGTPGNQPGNPPLPK